MNVKMEMMTGVVAQKYTHHASKYFLPFRLFSSAALQHHEKTFYPLTSLDYFLIINPIFFSVFFSTHFSTQELFLVSPQVIYLLFKVPFPCIEFNDSNAMKNFIHYLEGGFKQVNHKILCNSLRGKVNSSKWREMCAIHVL